MDRRTFLGGLAAASVPVTVVASTMPPDELVLYHAMALRDAMAAMHPKEIGWRVQIDHEHQFVTVARKSRRAQA
ncbi:hypothetical protein [Shinella sp. JR1-6]|uniref:hypothetical protein n=1 Tax=Shinella sp. JR1-6 TaxID=2527671 RepID=UPI00102D5EBF|nr:hypothetical protein [Shinella sp. JR1-6]TAA51064.1 hypothetical protein EXZ48_32075 [Shinella sp. JR1-6]